MTALARMALPTYMITAAVAAADVPLALAAVLVAALSALV